MSLWRRLAIERFPQLHCAIAKAAHVGSVFQELRYALLDADRADAEGAKPLDEKFVSGVYEYAHWCLHHRSIEVRTYVVVWFYEDVADHPVLSQYIGRWMAQEDFDLLEFAWRYVFKDEARVEAFQQDFRQQKAAAQRAERKCYWS